MGIDAYMMSNLPPKNNSELFSNLNMEWPLINIDNLLPHEETIPDRLQEMREKLEKRGFFHKPILIDKTTKTILDGHHKYRASIELNLNLIPVIEVEYLNNDSIKLELWPWSDFSNVSKQDVLNWAQNRRLYPPKTTKHIVNFPIPRIRIPLAELVNSAII